MVTDDASLRHQFRVSTERRSSRKPPKRHFAGSLGHNITSSLKLGTRPSEASSVISLKRTTDEP